MSKQTVLSASKTLKSKSNGKVLACGDKALERRLEGNYGIITPSKRLTMKVYLNSIDVLLEFKKEFGLSCASYMICCLVCLGYHTPSSISKRLYDCSTSLASVRAQLGVLIGRGLMERSDNKYYLTDKAMEAINRIRL
jgi:hypothetical protein